METDLKETPAAESKSQLAEILKIAFVVLFFVLVLLLALSMVDHRFFQGQRLRHNGTIGQ
jgi:hypothetical protein